MSPALVILRLIRFSPAYFWRCVLFAIILMCLIPIPLGIATQAFFDALNRQPAGLNAWTAVALLVSVQVIEKFVGPILGNPWSLVQQKSQVLLRRNLFAAILLGFGQRGLPESVGDTISRFRDEPELIADVIDAVCDLIGRSFFAIGAAIIMWRINTPLTLVMLAPLLLSTLATQALRDRVIAYRADFRKATGRVTGFLGQLMVGQLAVRVGGAVPNALARLVELGDARQRMAVRDRVLVELVESIEANLGYLITGLVLLLGAQWIRDGTFTVGDFALFVVYLDQLTWYPAEIARLTSGLNRAEVSFGRLHAIAPEQPAASLVAPAPVYLSETLPALPAPPSRERLVCLDVHGLTYAHPASGHGVFDISFSLERGAVTVITGRVGAGKTTLVQALLGLVPIDAGEMYWNGRRIGDPAAFFVPPRSAYTPQTPLLFSETLRDNVLLGYPADQAALEQAIRAAVVDRDVAVLEQGLETLIGPRGVKLSGGQQHRVAAARMFVREPELLVFDDLSSALDADTEAELWSRLFARDRATTCLVVSHRPGALGRADQVLLMDEGRLVASGHLDELLATSAVMRELYAG